MALLSLLLQRSNSLEALRYRSTASIAAVRAGCGVTGATGKSIAGAAMGKAAAIGNAAAEAMPARTARRDRIGVVQAGLIARIIIARISAEWDRRRSNQ
jgi:hypothetical protein